MTKENVLPFRRPASDSSGSGDDHDWLRDLVFEDRFLCQKKASNSYSFDAYGVALVLPEAVLLAGLSNDTPLTKFEWVDSKKFSKQHLLIALLPISEAKERGVTLHDYDHSPGPADGSDDDPNEGVAEGVREEEPDR